MQHEVAEVLFKGTLEDRREGSGVRSLLNGGGGGSDRENLGKECTQPRPHRQRRDAWCAKPTQHLSGRSVGRGNLFLRHRSRSLEAASQGNACPCRADE